MKNLSFVFSLLIFYNTTGKAQLIITGPQCVTINTAYQYNVAGNWKPGDKATICVEGGSFIEGTATCQVDSVFSFVRVIWNGDFMSGSLTLTSASEQGRIEVNICKPLLPGALIGEQSQEIVYNSMPASIQVLMPSGGSCSPTYSFQWESSDNGSAWTEIEGATKQHFEFTSPLLKTTYYRRRVTEHSSNIIAYSNPSVVYVDGSVNERQ